jgi:hypothetical protein
MSTHTRLVLFLGLVTLGCGGSTSQDGNSQPGGSGGTSSGGASSGGTSAGGSGGVGTGGTSTGGNAGSSGGGQGGYGGGDGCCTYDSDCPAYAADGLGQVCVNNVCKPEPKEPGVCWSDADCGGIAGSCVGASVCPCGADCFAPDQLGKCVVPDQCCLLDSDCVSIPEKQAVCVAGNCEAKPELGQCWTDADCAPGTACGGACVCPCGAVCACGGQMGWCEGPKPD